MKKKGKRKRKFTKPDASKHELKQKTAKIYYN